MVLKGQVVLAVNKLAVITAKNEKINTIIKVEKDNRGYSLVELIIVVAIIVAIVIMQIKGRSKE